MDWGCATYMAGLSTNTDKIDKKLRSEVVGHLNTIRAGLNKQQEGIIMQSTCTCCGFIVVDQSNAQIEIHVIVADN